MYVLFLSHFIDIILYNFITLSWVRSIPYDPDFVGKKQVAWAVHSALLGALLTPLAVIAGPIVYRAAFYTAGIIFGLSSVAVTAPAEEFIKACAPYSISLGLILGSSLGTKPYQKS